MIGPIDIATPATKVAHPR
jgi:hypothetical protein